jgi:hypothetical protein
MPNRAWMPKCCTSITPQHPLPLLAPMQQVHSPRQVSRAGALAYRLPMNPHASLPAPLGWPGGPGCRVAHQLGGAWSGTEQLQGTVTPVEIGALTTCPLLHCLPVTWRHVREEMRT